MWPFRKKPPPPISPVTRWVVDFDRYNFTGLNEVSFCAMRYDLHDTRWAESKGCGGFKSREEAEAWIHEHGDLPYEVRL